MTLKPCPFCGGEAEEFELEDEANFGGSVVCCTRCGASSAVHFDRKVNLISSWNTRTPSPSEGAVEVVERHLRNEKDGGTLDGVECLQDVLAELRTLPAHDRYREALEAFERVARTWVPHHLYEEAKLAFERALEGK